MAEKERTAGPMIPHPSDLDCFLIGSIIIRVVGLWFGKTNKRFDADLTFRASVHQPPCCCLKPLDRQVSQIAFHAVTDLGYKACGDKACASFTS